MRKAEGFTIGVNSYVFKIKDPDTGEYYRVNCLPIGKTDGCTNTKKRTPRKMISRNRETRAQMVEMYQAGINTKAISKKYGISRTLLYKIFREEGIVMRWKKTT